MDFDVRCNSSKCVLSDYTNNDFLPFGFLLKFLLQVFFFEGVLWIEIYLKFKWYQTSVGW